MNQITKITLAWELFEQEVPKSHIAQKLLVHRETIGLWVKGIQNNPTGLSGFIDKTFRPRREEEPKGSLMAY